MYQVTNLTLYLHDDFNNNSTRIYRIVPSCNAQTQIHRKFRILLILLFLFRKLGYLLRDQNVNHILREVVTETWRIELNVKIVAKA